MSKATAASSRSADGRDGRAPRTGRVLMPARTRRIVVTGGAGFVGSWLLRAGEAARERDGIEMIALSDRAGAEPGIDIRDAEAVSRRIAEIQPSALIHLAAIAAPAQARADAKLAWDVNVMGTLNLAQALRRHASEARFVYVGSSEAYGASFLSSPDPIGEDAAFLPRTPYGATKAAADLMIGQMAVDGLDCIRFRPFNHTGPGQSDSYVVAAFAKQVALIERGLQPPILKVGNLDAERDFLDVRDVVDAYLRSLEVDLSACPGVPVNLATGQPVRIGAILDALLAEAMVPIRVQTDTMLLRPNDVPRASGRSASARELLGWQPRRTLRQTLRDVLDYWRSH